MKRVIFIITIIFIPIVAKEITQVSKEIKRNIITNVNYFLPDFLRIDKEKSFITTGFSYDSLNNTIKPKVSVRLKLPEFVFTKVKLYSSDKNITKEKKLKIKIRPYIRVRKFQLKAFLGFIVTYKEIFYLLKGISNNFYYYPFDNYFTNTFKILFKQKKNSLLFEFNTDTDLFPRFSYKSGIYHLINVKENKITTYGLEAGGESEQYPVLYWYKLFYKYRHTLFNSKMAYFDITPYLYYSKEYNFTIKPAINISVTYKF